LLLLALLPAAARAEGPMVVTGRVVGPDGGPVAGAPVAVLVHLYRRSLLPDGTRFTAGLGATTEVWGLGKADADGRFRLTGPAYSPARPSVAASLVGSAPGYGIALVELDHAAPRQDVEIKLGRERVVRGRLIDLQGQPAPGATVRAVWPSPAFARDWFDRPLDELLPFWPAPATTDDKGRFLLRGLGPEKVTLEARGGRFAPQYLGAETASPEGGGAVTLSLVAARKLQGRVTYADSRAPAAGVRLVVLSGDSPFGTGYKKVEGRTDARGLFSLSVYPGEFLRVLVRPPDGSAYRTVNQVVSWAQVARAGISLAMPRGALVRGKVTESPSGRPVAGARVQYRPRQNHNPHYRPEVTAGDLEENLATAISGPGGEFRLAVPPGPGHLLVLGPTLDYVHVATSWGELEYGKPGGTRWYPDALVALDLKPGVEGADVTATLRRGVTVKGRVLGPDGKPVGRFRVLCRSYLPTGFQWRHRLNVLEGADGRFELPGCDPEKKFDAWFFEPKQELGATARLSGKQAGGESVTVRLQRCGAAAARHLGPGGAPRVNFAAGPQMVITPGAAVLVRQVGYDDDDAKDLEADWVDVASLAPGKYEGLRTDDKGRVTFPALIPGATYRALLPGGAPDRVRTKGTLTRDFTVGPGETVTLPDVTWPRAR
jgi:protocatechuate 3,4-dioxygenase beta subunit